MSPKFLSLKITSFFFVYLKKNIYIGGLCARKIIPMIWRQLARARNLIRAQINTFKVIENLKQNLSNV